MSWELREPLKLPKHYLQLEVPYMIHREGYYYLFVSTQNQPTEPDNKDKQAAYRGYRAPSITGPWQPLYAGVLPKWVDDVFPDSDKIELDKIYGWQIYAPTVFEKSQGSGEYAAVAFFSVMDRYQLTGTPIVEIDWSQKIDDVPVPIFRFKETFKGLL
jgi:hypothetical protein